MPDNIKNNNISDKSCQPKGLWYAFFVSFVILAAAGIAGRYFNAHFQPGSDIMTELAVPLKNFPAILGNWSGSDIVIPENIQKVAGNDDFINRSYINRSENLQSHLYIAYSGRPSTMLGHRPDKCYVGSGWIRDSSDKSSFVTAKGMTIPCIIHRFHTPAPNFEQIFVINFYILNGTATNDESVFSGLGWRTPNIKGDPARYVAQVQVTSGAENSALKAAKDWTDEILKFLPKDNLATESTEGKK